MKCEESKYALGSVLNHVMLHQSVIGLEAERQMRLVGDGPTWSSAASAAAAILPHFIPFMRYRLQGQAIRFVAVEPRSCRR